MATLYLMIDCICYLRHTRTLSQHTRGVLSRPLRTTFNFFTRGLTAVVQQHLFFGLTGAVTAYPRRESHEKPPPPSQASNLLPLSPPRPPAASSQPCPLPRVHSSRCRVEPAVKVLLVERLSLSRDDPGGAGAARSAPGAWRQLYFCFPSCGCPTSSCVLPFPPAGLFRDRQISDLICGVDFGSVCRWTFSLVLLHESWRHWQPPWLVDKCNLRTTEERAMLVGRASCVGPAALGADPTWTIKVKVESNGRFETSGRPRAGADKQKKRRNKKGGGIVVPSGYS